MRRLISFAATAMIVAGCTSTMADSPAAQLRQRLARSSVEGKILFGHHDDPVYGHTWCGDSGRSDALESAGAYPAVMSWDLGELERGKTANLDGVDFERMRSEVRRQNARGGINTFSWHLRHALSEADSWDTNDSLSVSRLVNTLEGRAAFNSQLDRLADFFLSLTDDDGKRIGVIFRPWHEHTGNWFWWGAANCSVGDYKQLWQMTRRRFDERGVDNVLWAYSPDRVADTGQYLERYPGDSLVDILGADVYHFDGAAGQERYHSDAVRTLTIAAEQARLRGKLFAFTETGLESVTLPQWYTANLLPVLQAVPGVAYVTVWRNAHNNPRHFYVPYKGHPAQPDFNKFSKIPNIVFVK